MRRRFHLTFPERFAGEPVLFTMGREFGVVPNIRRASVEEAGAWMIVELEGDEPAVGGAVRWLAERGVHVDRLDDEGV